MPFGLFRRSNNRDVINRLHGEIVAMVRQPSLYQDYGVEDTFEGRFELLVLISALFVRRLALLPPPGPDMAQELTDGIFAALDSSMREMGVGDLAVPKRMKKLASSFLGRRQAYEEGLQASDRDALAIALSRNVHGGKYDPESPEVRRLAQYAYAILAVLQGLAVEDFKRGGIAFPTAESIEERS